MFMLKCIVVIANVYMFMLKCIVVIANVYMFMFICKQGVNALGFLCEHLIIIRMWLSQNNIHKY